MRKVVPIAAGLFLIACGPDPNAQLPGLATQSKTGGTSGSGGIVAGTGGAAQGGGGVVGSGGAPAKGGSGGANPFAGGATGSTGGIVSTGGVVGSGGAVGSGGIPTGGVVGSGGIVPTGGLSGSGGVSGTGGGMDIDGGGGSEPCVPDKTIAGSGSGNSGSFGTTGAFCFRTADAIAGWNCSNFTGRTLKVNGTTETCGALPLPAKVNGYYYFDSSAGGVDYASIYWY